MQKTGWEKLKNRAAKGKKTSCQRCRRVATKKVTFEDEYGKSTIKLCDSCAEREYFDLCIQGRFVWPEGGKVGE